MQNERESDVKNVCFVCGFSRFDFNKKNLDFEQHLLNEHDPWQYLAFLYYMSEIGENELNGLENNAWDNFKEINTDWLPIGNTVYLPMGENDDAMEKIQSSVDSLSEKLEGIENLNKNILD